MVTCKKMHSTSADEVINKLVNKAAFFEYCTLLSFSSPPFSSWKLKYLNHNNNIKQVYSPAYFHQPNGQTERAVQDVKSLLKRKLQDANTQDWKKTVQKIQTDIRFAQMPLLY